MIEHTKKLEFTRKNFQNYNDVNMENCAHTERWQKCMPN